VVAAGDASAGGGGTTDSAIDYNYAPVPATARLAIVATIRENDAPSPTPPAPPRCGVRRRGGAEHDARGEDEAVAAGAAGR